jgi:hypothetical protein
MPYVTAHQAKERLSHLISKRKRRKMMNNKHIRIWIPVVTGLTLVVLLLLAGSANARLSPPVTPATQPHAATASSWSSGWVSITAGTCQTLTHNLGADPEDYALSLLFWDTDGSLGINRRNYGGLEWSNNWYGAYWQRLTANTIQVCRMANDNTVDRIRVQLWIPDTVPDYDSGWTDINPGETITFSHSVGITATELSVSLWFSGTARGIHHYGYGGLTVDAPPSLEGAYWHNLTTNTVQVSRQMNDTAIEQVRVVVVHGDPPDYDSGWQSINPNTIITLEHNLSRLPGLLLTRGECFSPTVGGPGIHQWFAGGDYSLFGKWQGTNIQNLTANTVQMARRADDFACPFVRIRIWAPEPEYKVYLPLVVNNYAPEVELAYDDGTADSWQSHDKDSGFAVLFTTPGTSAQLVRARYYLDSHAGATHIEVHVWDTAHNDLLTPFTVTPSTGEGWLDVDLSGYNLTVSGDFYVGFLYPGAAYDPSLGVDTSNPDGRSYEVPWQAFGNDYMVRAVVVSQ